MSLVFALLAASAPSVMVTRHEVRSPSAAQVEAYESRSVDAMAREIPMTDSVIIELPVGERRNFSSHEIAGFAELGMQGADYLLWIDTGSYEARTPLLLGECQTHVVKRQWVRAGESYSQIVVETVTVGRNCF